MKMMRIAIIPARGGSKGVPRKNVRLVAGKPLIAWNIEAALHAKLVDEVIVSTDDDEIAAVSEKYGARVIRRPLEISGDTASSESALLHVLSVLKTQGSTPHEVVFLQCTSPLTTSEDIDNCINKLEASQADSAFTAKEFFYFVWKLMPDGSADGINHDKSVRPRRQDREPQYEENGAVYVMRTEGFLKAKHRFFGKTVMSLMPESRCYEVDTEFDLEVVSRLISHNLACKTTLREFPRKCKAVIFDFDGVMTDDTVWTDSKGVEAVRCSRSDGQGISRAKQYGLHLMILSSEENPVVTQRARKLGIEVIQGVGIHKKIDVLKTWIHQAEYCSLEEVVYTGNDLNDVECMRAVGYAIAPADATEEVRALADMITSAKGGHGAVREALQFICKEIGKPL